jgi:hypothetical protein
MKSLAVGTTSIFLKLYTTIYEDARTSGCAGQDCWYQEVATPLNAG